MHRETRHTDGRLRPMGGNSEPKRHVYHGISGYNALRAHRHSIDAGGALGAAAHSLIARQKGSKNKNVSVCEWRDALHANKIIAAKAGKRYTNR